MHGLAGALLFLCSPDIALCGGGRPAWGWKGLQNDNGIADGMSTVYDTAATLFLIVVGVQKARLCSPQRMSQLLAALHIIGVLHVACVSAGM
eukprot:scaffold324302_cov31-Prasinocladus_malaysianus.AAC.1